MTKEELVQKAENSYWENHCVEQAVTEVNLKIYTSGYVAGYRQGASELEVENERLKAIVLGNEEEISELEKENAELKETLKNVRCALIQDKNVAYMSLADSLFDLQVSKGGE